MATTSVFQTPPPIFQSPSPFLPSSSPSCETIDYTSAISTTFFDLLYTQDPLALHAFHQNHQRLPLASILSNPAITTLLHQHEPGPKIDHSALCAGLTTLSEQLLRQKIATTTVSSVLKFFHSGLLTHRQNWINAAADHYSFLAYRTVLILNRIPYQASLFAQHESSSMTTLSTTSNQLIEFKKSDEMWSNSGLLWHLLEQTHQLTNARFQMLELEKSKKAAEELHKEEEKKRRQEVRRQNEWLLARQMGQQSSGVMDGEAERGVLEFLDQQVRGQGKGGEGDGEWNGTMEELFGPKELVLHGMGY